MMSKRSIKNSRAWFLATAAICTLTIVRCATAAPALEEVAAGITIDPTQISVSGISSGGFMAHQFHVAHSENIKGVGIVAGGPYYCASGSVQNAVQKCSQFFKLECEKWIIFPIWKGLCDWTDMTPKNTEDARKDAKASFDEAKKQEAAGNISKLAGLKDAKVYLFSAKHDVLVPHGVMDAVFHFYADPDKAGIEVSNIDYNNRTFPARHTMVRDGFNKPVGGAVGDCPLPPVPSPLFDKDAFIDDCESVAKRREAIDGCVCPPPNAGRAASGAVCPPEDKQAACKHLQDVDLAGAILKHIYGELKGGRVEVAEGEVKAFDQRLVFERMFPDNPFTQRDNASMAYDGYVFIPETCKKGRPCKLHVAFHGCLQGGNATDRRSGQWDSNLFAKFAGYNEWAQANDIIVLYPQVRVWKGTLASPPINPQGCWDWWGEYYTHENYHTQGGIQIKAVAQMINILAGNKKLLPIPAQ
jgi:hypothetical protein